MVYVTTAGGSPISDQLYGILRNCDLVMSCGSTTDVEALLMGKDVIMMDTLRRADPKFRKLLMKDKYLEGCTVIDKRHSISKAIDAVLPRGKGFIVGFFPTDHIRYGLDSEKDYFEFYTHYLKEVAKLRPRVWRLFVKLHPLEVKRSKHEKIVKKLGLSDFVEVFR